MTLLDHRGPDPAELLIKQARDRQRRRRRRSSLAVLIAVVLGAGSYLAATGGSDSGGHQATPLPRATSPKPAAVPAVDAAAMRGHGTLAFLSRGALWLLDGSTGSLRKLMPAKDMPSSPTFSADGKWLVFNTTSPKGRYDTWLARRDGSGLQRIPLPDVESDGWSPSGHRLAVDFNSPRRDVTAVGVVSPGRPVHVVAHVVGLTGVTWSPAGRQLAVASDDGVAPVRSRSIRPPAADNPRGRTSLVSFPVNGGAPTTWFSTNDRHGRLLGLDELRLTTVGWWRGHGIGFWVDGDGAVLNPDQSPLEEVRRPGATPILLGSTLSNHEEPSVVAAPNGEVAIVGQTGRDGFGRQIWWHKRLAACAPDQARCEPVRAPTHTVTLDPAWAPDGRTLAYVVAPARSSPAFPQGVVRRWYAAHRLALYDPRTGRVRMVRGSAGASVPTWSGNGRLLMYAAHDGLWLLRRGASKPVRVATPLFAPGGLPAYYGQVDWVGQFAWSAAG